MGQGSRSLGRAPRAGGALLLLLVPLAGAPANGAVPPSPSTYAGLHPSSADSPRAASPPANPPDAPVLPDEPCTDRRYPDCRRLRFFYGPIEVTPGANFQMVGPMAVPKPSYDGYMIRFRPDLVHSDGSRPLVDQVML